MRRVLVGALATASFVLASAGTASAWWAEGSSYFSGSSGVVSVYAEPGEQNDLRAIGLLGNQVSVLLHDPSTPVTPAPAGQGLGCDQVDGHTLRCIGRGFMGSPVSVSYLRVELGDGDDRLRTSPSPGLFKLGSTGSGNDTVVANDLSGASISLGEGDDRITLRGSGSGFLPNDAISGGAGDDVLRLVNGAADDNPYCGDGNDVLYADAGESNADCETVHQFP